MARVGRSSSRLDTLDERAISSLPSVSSARTRSLKPSLSGASVASSLASVLTWPSSLARASAGIGTLPIASDAATARPVRAAWSIGG